jgi:hypothetical protein
MQERVDACAALNAQLAASMGGFGYGKRQDPICLNDGGMWCRIRRPYPLSPDHVYEFGFCPNTAPVSKLHIGMGERAHRSACFFARDTVRGRIVLLHDGRSARGTVEDFHDAMRMQGFTVAPVAEGNKRSPRSGVLVTDVETPDLFPFIRAMERYKSACLTKGRRDNRVVTDQRV